MECGDHECDFGVTVCSGNLGSHRFWTSSNNDHVQQARWKGETPQGTSLVYSWIVPISKLNAIQAPKKQKVEDDEETKAFKDKQKADAAAAAAMRDKGEQRALHSYDEGAESGLFL